jgi:hypothetical protein
MNQKYLSMSSNFKANMTIEMKTLLPSPWTVHENNQSQTSQDKEAQEIPQ